MYFFSYGNSEWYRQQCIQYEESQSKENFKENKILKKNFWCGEKKKYCCYAYRNGWIPLTFLFEDQLHESDFSSVALDPKHFASFIFCQGKVISRYSMVRKGGKKKEKQQDTAW